MEINTLEQKDSITLSKSSVGVGWSIKLYRKDNESEDDLIKRIKLVHEKLLKEYPTKKKE